MKKSVLLVELWGGSLSVDTRRYRGAGNRGTDRSAQESLKMVIRIGILTLKADKQRYDTDENLRMQSIRAETSNSQKAKTGTSGPYRLFGRLFGGL